MLKPKRKVISHRRYFGASKPRNKVKHIEPKRVCRILEEIAMELINGDDKDPLNNFACTVYTYCHITSAACINSHRGWVDEFRETEKQMLGFWEERRLWWKREQKKRDLTLEVPLTFFAGTDPV